MKIVKVITLIFSAAVVLAIVMIWGSRTGMAQGPITDQSGEDLAVELFEVTPSNPTVYQPVTITMRVRNVGTVEVPGRRFYMYIAPADQPPNSTTPATREEVHFLAWPPGDAMTVQYTNYKFGQSGPLQMYAWVDPLEVFAETDETNNLASLQINVQPDGSTAPDDYEPDNDCRDAVNVPVGGAAQLRKFETSSDTDWGKFMVQAGKSYTVTAVGTGSEADPTFHFWDSCIVPPQPSFGSTRVIKATKNGTLYLKIENFLTVADKNKATYRLSIQDETGTGATPTVNSLSPTAGDNDQQTTLTLTGSNFGSPPLIELCPLENNSCSSRCIQLLKKPDYINDQQVEATVQKNLPQGEYCVAVTNPNGSNFTQPGQTFTITSGVPDIRSLHPSHGANNISTDLHLYGQRFDGSSPQISVNLGSTSLADVTVFNGTHLKAVVPDGFTPGTYDVSVSYGSGKSDTLAQAFTVQSEQEDLYTQDQELWVAQEVDKVKLALLVHRRGGSQPLNGVSVNFKANGQSVGSASIPLLAPDDDANTPWLEWTPPSAGTYTIEAVIDSQADPGSQTNNTATQQVELLAGGDVQSPRVDALTINGLNVVSDTNDPLVLLGTTATDPAPGQVDKLRYLEFAFNQGANIWTPVWDSGWIANSVENSTLYQRELTPVGGIHYIQAWAKDSAGNISHYPYQLGVNYVSPQGRVNRDAGRVYRRTLSAGEALKVTVNPLTGDPDLYIWPPDWQSGVPPWVSNLPSGAEEITFQAHVDGDYQIEVYGYTTAEYELFINRASSTRQVLALDSVDPSKTIPATPLSGLSLPGTPPLTSGEDNANVYLPLVIKE